MNNVLRMFKKAEPDPRREEPYGRLNRALKRHGVEDEIWGETSIHESTMILLNAFADILERIEAKRDE
jgi:hypothetical protein